VKHASVFRTFETYLARLPSSTAKLNGSVFGSYAEKGETNMRATGTWHSTIGETDIDWTGCELVERVPGKVSGRATVRGTRILADTIVQDAALGSTLQEIHENYPDLSMDVIRALISFGQSGR
jgi:uncharacterized protein (DUF433 family)